MASRLIAVTPAEASDCIRAGSRSGDSRPMTAWPLRSLAASSADGFWTRRMTSAPAYRSAVLTTVAPASVNAWSGIRAPAPAPASTRISHPAAVSLPSASGTRATRRSPGAVSLATPTFMGITVRWGHSMWMSRWYRRDGTTRGCGPVARRFTGGPGVADASTIRPAPVRGPGPCGCPPDGGTGIGAGQPSSGSCQTRMPPPAAFASYIAVSACPRRSGSKSRRPGHGQRHADGHADLLRTVVGGVRAP